MKRKNLFLLLLGVSSLFPLSAQTLFTYGPYKADAAEFLRAFNKNNVLTGQSRATAMREYLDLYIRSKLKVREAVDRRYDTLQHIRMEVDNLRAQIVENFMNDPAILNRLRGEAFQRSQKLIKAAHIFIAFKQPNGAIDTAAARQQLDEVNRKIAAGQDFSQLAIQYSDDPAVQINKGYLGYVTVFTLPYDMENALYATAAGKVGEPVRSKIGYHLFKNMGEKKNPGRMKAQQILLAWPPDADESIKKQVAQRADSLYKRLLAGEDFGALARAFSNDYISAANNGIMPDLSVGQYDPLFEEQCWALAKDGALSKPFRTSHGWHILRRISIKPPVTDPENRDLQQELQQKIMLDSRWQASKDYIYNQVKQKAGVTYLLNDEAAFRAYSDSLLDRQPMATAGKNLQPSSPVFRIGEENFDLAAWYKYASVYRYRNDGSGFKPFEQVKDEWLKYEMQAYYKRNLEAYNTEFRNQMNEFRDGNLFFEIMQQEVWTRAQTDTLALRSLYEKNKKNYTWKESADVVIFFCSDAAMAQTLYEKVKAAPGDWRKLTGQYDEKVLADSSRYEWSQIPNLNKTVPKAGMLTSPLLNESDNTASFAYIFNAYPQTLQRSFNEARGLVINDYQLILEKQWEEALFKKYPVKVEEKVLEQLMK